MPTAVYKMEEGEPVYMSTILSQRERYQRRCERREQRFERHRRARLKGVPVDDLLQDTSFKGQCGGTLDKKMFSWSEVDHKD